MLNYSWSLVNLKVHILFRLVCRWRKEDINWGKVGKFRDLLKTSMPCRRTYGSAVPILYLMCSSSVQCLKAKLLVKMKTLLSLMLLMINITWYNAVETELCAWLLSKAWMKKIRKWLMKIQKNRSAYSQFYFLWFMCGAFLGCVFHRQKWKKTISLTLACTINQ